MQHTCLLLPGVQAPKSTISPQFNPAQPFSPLSASSRRRDHAASEQRMREARAAKEGAADDVTALTKQMHEMRAAREDAERELGGVVAMFDQVRSDWHKKLKDRRKEVGAGWGGPGHVQL